MIVCPRCSKENQDHYKFCLGCGAELPRDAAHQPKSFSAPTPPAGFPTQGQGAGPAAPAFGAPAPAPGFGAPAAPAFGAPQPAPGFGAPQPASGFGAPQPAPGFGAPQPVGQFGGAAAPAPQPAPAPAAPGGFGAAPAAAGDALTCPKCGNKVPRNFKFCGTCGLPMAEVAAGQKAGGAAAAPAAAAPVAMPAPGGKTRGSLVVIRSDGTEGDTSPLGDPVTVIGRDAGGPFASDSYLSPRHATFTFKGNGLVVKDENSLNGVYMRIEREVPTELPDGSIFRIGQEIIRFERVAVSAPGRDGVEVMGAPNPGFLGRIALVIGRETTANSYCIAPHGLHMGRERGDIVFPDDGYVSGLHCRIHGESGRVMLTDVGSSNGTFVRLKANVEHQVRPGSLLLMGQQLFRVEY